MANGKVVLRVVAWLGFAALLTIPLFSAFRMMRSPAYSKNQPAPQSARHYSILIDLDENTLTLLENGRILHRYPCAVGKSDTPSPVGYFRITRKSLWGEGFGGYFLGLNVPWGIYGIHGTTDPASVGQDVSHGCFRLLDEDIRQLYDTVDRGTPVLVVSGVYGAFGTGLRTIAPGMYGQDVRLIQQTLRRLGYYSGPCTGKYDTTAFEEAVHRFQQDYGLPQADSISRKMIQILGLSAIE